MAHIGEEGTEQFTVATRLNGDLVGPVRQIHDPFIHTTVVIGWRDMLKGLLTRKLRVEVTVRGTHAAQSRIMTMDPAEMQRENLEWEEECAWRRRGVELGTANAAITHGGKY